MRGYMIHHRSSGEVAKTIATTKKMTSKKQNKERLKQAIDNIKMIMRNETDPFIRKRIAEAGLQLNSLFLKD